MTVMAVMTVPSWLQAFFPALVLIYTVLTVLVLLRITAAAWRVLPPALPRLPLLLLGLLLAVGVFWTTAWEASNCWVTDSFEYAAAAQRLAATGTYAVVVNGQELPPRYSPWFSALILTPGYWWDAAELGSGIYPLNLYILATFFLALLLGVRAGAWGLLLTAAFLALLPGWRYFGAIILTDVVFSCAGIFALSHFLDMKRRKESGSADWAVAGWLVAWSYCLRPLGLVLILPFLLRLGPQRRPLQLLWLLGPSLVFLLLTGIYQQAVFGSWLRSGYHFWLPVPYEFSGLTFSWDFVGANLQVLFSEGLIFMALVVAALVLLRRSLPAAARRISPELRGTLQFLLLSGIPLLLVHLFYFYSTPRFFLPLQVLLVLLFALLAGELAAQRLSKSWVPVLILGLLTLGVWGDRLFSTEKEPGRRELVMQAAELLPESALLIASFNPAYWEHFLGTGRQVLPWSRDLIYANQLLAPKPISRFEPRPRSPFDHRAELLQTEPGTIDLYPEVAKDNWGYLEGLRHAELPLYLDGSELEPAQLAEIERHFALREVAEGLFRVYATVRR